VVENLCVSIGMEHGTGRVNRTVRAVWGRTWTEFCDTSLNPKPKKMKHVLTTAALCLAMVGAQAQSEKVQPSAMAPHNCVTSTTNDDWKNLGLSEEQSAKVKDIQAECMKMEHKMMADRSSSKESPMMMKYEEKVKEVLTPEQYEKWMKWCNTHAQRGDMEKSKKMEEDKGMEDN